MCAAPLWSSKCAYLTTTGIRYSQLSRETQDAVVTRYFGIFFLIFQSGQIWGNLISSLVLQQGVNDTFRENADEVCGARFCSDPPKLTNATDEYDHKLVIRLLSIYVATGVFAVLLVIALLDRLTGSLDRRKEQESGVNLLIATLKHLTDKRMLLVLPLTMFSGLEQAFTFADFTAVKYALLVYLLNCLNRFNNHVLRANKLGNNKVLITSLRFHLKHDVSDELLLKQPVWRHYIHMQKNFALT